MCAYQIQSAQSTGAVVKDSIRILHVKCSNIKYICIRINQLTSEQIPDNQGDNLKQRSNKSGIDRNFQSSHFEEVYFEFVRREFSVGCFLRSNKQLNNEYTVTL